MVIKIGHLAARSGEKVMGSIGVPETTIKLPVTLINGNKAGKTVLITGGVHNAEYTGIETAIRLADEIQPDEISGCLILIHPVNTSGFEKRTMSVVAEDGKNLNRIFPGNPNGTEGDKLCHFLATAVLSQIDFYIDLHAGDGYENLTPYVYYLGAAAPEVVEQSKVMAQKVNVRYLVKSFTTTGGVYNYAGSCGIPSILIERGGQGRWSEEEVKLYKADVKNVLRHLAVLEGTVNANEYEQVEIENVIYENASVNGCWYPYKKAGEMIKKGEELGVIKDYFGKVLQSCSAKYDGLILYQVSSLCILKNEAMVVYGEVEN
ncbi:M14 family metallopeptidase [Acetobacterium woodii]|uniref:M14 family metallopeptidase n=1 Tax=Acetobacterium woodii TaxID=33952 RepID=UPI0002E52148|nr:M14 family metallopeptidase [Acetobacterium woodii]